MKDYIYKPPIDQDKLKEMFFLHPSHGVFHRKTDVGRRTGRSANDKFSEVRGTMTASGALRMMVDGQYYQVHHLVWLYIHGEFPTFKLGHIDGDKTNNAIGNLKYIPKGRRSLPEPDPSFL